MKNILLMLVIMLSFYPALSLAMSCLVIFLIQGKDLMTALALSTIVFVFAMEFFMSLV